MTRENKRYTAVNTGTTSASGALVGITVNIAQGDNISNRNGDQIRVDGVTYRFGCTLNASATVERVRFIFFTDHYNLGSTPAVTDVLNTADVFSGFNPINMQAKRFKILHDQTLTLCTSGNAGRTATCDLSFKKSKVVQFTGTTGAQGAGHFYFIVLSDIGATNGGYEVSWDLVYQDA